MNSDLILLLVLLIWIILGTSVLCWPPLRVLFLGTFFGAIVFRVPLLDWPSVIGMGFISTVKKIGVLILLGSWIGVLRNFGATLSIAKALLSKMAKWPLHLWSALSVVGFPYPFFVMLLLSYSILSTINWLKKSNSKNRSDSSPFYRTFATHVLVPPTPGPLAATFNSHNFLFSFFGGAVGLCVNTCRCRVFLLDWTECKRNNSN